MMLHGRIASVSVAFRTSGLICLCTPATTSSSSCRPSTTLRLLSSSSLLDSDKSSPSSKGRSKGGARSDNNNNADEKQTFQYPEMETPYNIRLGTMGIRMHPKQAKVLNENDNNGTKVELQKFRKEKLGPDVLPSAQFQNIGNVGAYCGEAPGPRLAEYRKISAMAAALPTIREKLDFVSPYERPWREFERRWRRVKDPPLVQPRGAFVLDPITQQYDSMQYYQYLTKTVLNQPISAGDANNIGHFYDSQYNPSTEAFEERVTSTLMTKLLNSSKVSGPPVPRAELVEARCNMVDQFLRQMTFDALQTLGHLHKHLEDARVVFTERCESYWVRCGFEMVYRPSEYLEYAKQNRLKYSCDDRRKLGELAFVCRDKMAAQLRARTPMPQLCRMLTEERYMTEDDVDLDDPIYPPKSVLPVWSDKKNPLLMAPGFDPESDETHRFGMLGIRNSCWIDERLRHWGLLASGVSEQEVSQLKRDTYTAAAVMSLFSWLNGQAHSLGFTQYNELTYPLTSQLILSNGREFFFAVGQLNTIAINVRALENQRINHCWVQGPFALYDHYNKEQGPLVDDEEDSGGDSVLRPGLRANVLKCVLQMFMHQPTRVESLSGRDLTPFLPKVRQVDNLDTQYVLREAAAGK